MEGLPLKAGFKIVNYELNRNYPGGGSDSLYSIIKY
jgi:hypothetical protein